MLLLVGDDWAEDHHDVEVMDSAGRTLAKARLPEGISGLTRLHALVAAQLGDQAGEADEAEVRIGIETDRGPWVAALVAAGYTVYPVNPLQAARYRERHGVSGAKSDPADAVKVVARAHKTLIWERSRQTQRLRHALREYFPAALAAFDDLDAGDTLELLAKAPYPAAAARLSRATDLGRAASRPPPRRRHQDHGDPGRAARPAAGPTGGGGRRVRRHDPRRGRGAGHAQRADYRARRTGRGAFSAAPGRRDPAVPAGDGRGPRCPGPR